LLHRLASRDCETGAREDVDALEVSAAGELAERAGEEVVASGARGALAVLVPRRGASAPELGAIDQVVVHERCNVRELDRNTCTQGSFAIRRRQVDEQGTQPLAAGRDGIPADRCHEPRVSRDGELQPVLELVEIRTRFL
jgi:hypothetical protein